MIRRSFLGAFPLAGLAKRSKLPADRGRVEIWEWETCGCGRQVAFLPGQHKNRCAWCRRRVRH